MVDLEEPSSFPMVADAAPHALGHDGLPLGLRGPELCRPLRLCRGPRPDPRRLGDLRRDGGRAGLAFSLELRAQLDLRRACWPTWLLPQPAGGASAWRWWSALHGADRLRAGHRPPRRLPARPRLGREPVPSRRLRPGVADHHAPEAARPRHGSLLSVGFQGGICGGERLGRISRPPLRLAGGILGAGQASDWLSPSLARFIVTDAPKPTVLAAGSVRASVALRYLAGNALLPPHRGQAGAGRGPAPGYSSSGFRSISSRRSTSIWVRPALPAPSRSRSSLILGAALGGWSFRRASPGGWPAKYRMLVLGACYVLAAPILLVFLLHPGFTAVTVAAVSAWSLLRGMGGASERPGDLPRSSRPPVAPPPSAS